MAALMKHRHIGGMGRHHRPHATSSDLRGEGRGRRHGRPRDTSAFEQDGHRHLAPEDGRGRDHSAGRGRFRAGGRPDAGPGRSGRFAARGSKTLPASVLEAMETLGLAMRLRLRQGSLDTDSVARIAAALDDAARAVTQA